jgi:hypothetical protein
MILSSINNENLFFKFINTKVSDNYCKFYIKLSTIILDFEYNNIDNIYYKIDIIIKYSNTNSYYLNPLYNYSKDNNFTFLIYKNSLSDNIIYYLKACDYELNLNCNNIIEYRKLLLIFLYYLNENI